MNQVNLIGRLSKDIEVRYTQSGKAVGSGSIAVNRRFKSANGERLYQLCYLGQGG